ncbi:MAG TPA: hypothetical protein VJH71_03115 [Candidatus Paceibacterota bacterium]
MDKIQTIEPTYLTESEKDFADGLLTLCESILGDGDKTNITTSIYFFPQAIEAITAANQAVLEANNGVEVKDRDDNPIDVDYNLTLEQISFEKDIQILKRNLDLVKTLDQILNFLVAIVLGKEPSGYLEKIAELKGRFEEYVRQLRDFIVSGQEVIDELNYETLHSNATGKTWRQIM